MSPNFLEQNYYGAHLNNKPRNSKFNKVIQIIKFCKLSKFHQSLVGGQVTSIYQSNMLHRPTGKTYEIIVYYILFIVHISQTFY